jgi:hypothetical protein
VCGGNPATPGAAAPAPSHCPAHMPVINATPGAAAMTTPRDPDETNPSPACVMDVRPHRSVADDRYRSNAPATITDNPGHPHQAHRNANPVPARAGLGLPSAAGVVRARRRDHARVRHRWPTVDASWSVPDSARRSRCALGHALLGRWRAVTGHPGLGHALPRILFILVPPGRAGALQLFIWRCCSCRHHQCSAPFHEVLGGRAVGMAFNSR